MLSTPLSTVAIVVLLLALVLAIVIGFYRKGSGGTLSLPEFIELRGRIEAMEQLHADLADRFTRFQKREGMREAREVKAGDKSLQQEAADILAGQSEGVAGGNVQTSSRKDLYRRAGMIRRK